MKHTRRSFLSLIAASMASAAIPAAAIERALSARRAANPPLDEIWQQYMVWDTVKVFPHEAVDEVLFSAPFPDDFLIDRIGLSWGSRTRAADLARLFDNIEFRMESDSKTGLGLCAAARSVRPWNW